MKLFKKIFVTTLILTTTLCGSTVDGFAKDETHITNEVASESFKTFIEPLYNEAKNIIVYNANNENVTHSFIMNTQELYNNNKLLKTIFMNMIYCLKRRQFQIFLPVI